LDYILVYLYICVFVFKVSVNYKNGVRSKVVTDPVVQAAVKCIANSRNEKAIARALYAGNFKHHFHELVNETIASEAQKLCSSVDKSCLQHKEAKDVIDIDWGKIILEWQSRAPVFKSFLTSATVNRRSNNDHPERCDPFIAMAGSILLYNRNPAMSLVQQAVGLVLDHGGVTKEVTLLYN
jgi:hypothetical protein